MKVEFIRQLYLIERVVYLSYMSTSDLIVDYSSKYVGLCLVLLFMLDFSSLINSLFWLG